MPDAESGLIAQGTCSSPSITHPVMAFTKWMAKCADNNPFYAKKLEQIKMNSKTKGFKVSKEPTKLISDSYDVCNQRLRELLHTKYSQAIFNRFD